MGKKLLDPYYNSTTSDTLIQEYRSLISPNQQPFAIPEYTYLLPERFPFGTFNIKNDNCLILSKLDEVDQVELKTIDLISSYGSQSGTTDSIYNVINENFFKVSHLMSTPSPIKNIYLSILGTSVRRLSIDDSTVIFRGNVANFSIKYIKEGPIDIYGYTNLTLSLPMDIYFLKRMGHLYLAIVSVNNTDNKLLTNPFI
jgi:hypothetical protein